MEKPLKKKKKSRKWGMYQDLTSSSYWHEKRKKEKSGDSSRLKTEKNQTKQRVMF